MHAFIKQSPAYYGTSNYVLGCCMTAPVFHRLFITVIIKYNYAPTHKCLLLILCEWFNIALNIPFLPANLDEKVRDLTLVCIKLGLAVPLFVSYR